MTLATRSFGLALVCIGLLALSVRLWIAGHAWFVTDDFYFLHWIQSPRWSWSEVFLPTFQRGIEVYRPVGLDSYFLLNFAVFGWNATGYFVSGIVLQVAVAATIYRIARQENYELRVAWTTAMIAAVGGPSLSSTYAVAEHNYLCATLFYALSITFFLDYFRNQRTSSQIASCVALLLGLWSNELVVMAAALVYGLAFARANAGDPKTRALVALRRSWPHLAITTLFVDFRVSAVQWRQYNWFYEPDFGPDMISNSLGNLARASGGGYRLLLVVLIGTAAAAVIVRAREKWSGLGFAWLVLGLAPFAVLAFPTTRFGLALLPAMALSTGALVSAVIGRLGHAQLQSCALIGLVLLCVPWEDAANRMQYPGAEPQRHAFSVVRNTLPADHRNCVIVLCGGDGLANAADCAELRGLTFGGAMFRAVVPQRELAVEFDDARVRLAAFEGRDCLTYELRADQRLAVSKRSNEGAGEDELSQLR